MTSGQGEKVYFLCDNHKLCVDQPRLYWKSCIKAYVTVSCYITRRASRLFVGHHLPYVLDYLSLRHITMHMTKSPTPPPPFCILQVIKNWRWEQPENKAMLAAVDLVSYPGPTLSGGVWERDYKSGVHMPLDNSEITSFSRYPPFCWASQTLNPKWNSSSLLWVKHFAHSSNNEFCTWIFVFLASE